MMNVSGEQFLLWHLNNSTTEMKSRKPCAFLLIVLLLVTPTLGVFQQLVIRTVGVPCAVDTPTTIVPIVAIPLVQTCVPSSVFCSWKCHMDPSCIGYNVIATKKQCQFYNYIPINFVINTTCQYFQVGNPLP